MEKFVLYDANGKPVERGQSPWKFLILAFLFAFGVVSIGWEFYYTSRPIKKPSAGMSIEWRETNTPDAPDHLENKLGDPILHVDPIICEESINGAAKHDVKCIHPPSDLPCARHRDNCVFDF